MIEEVRTGRLIPVEIIPVSSPDLQSLEVGWSFSWEQEAKQSEVYKLVAAEDPAPVLGLMSIERRPGFIEVKLLESSPANVGRGKIFKGIAGSLLAFAAKLSFQLNNDGVLMLISKTVLIDHYAKVYGFIPFRGRQKMILGTSESARLIAFYGGED